MSVQRRAVIIVWLLVLARTAVIQEKCRLIELMSRTLLYENRVLYMSDYFPIDYQLPVKYEEILQCQNISSLISEGITVEELHFLWGMVSDNVLLRLMDVLPQRHPSRVYIKGLRAIFASLHKDTELELSDLANDILKRLWTPGDAVKRVAPKNLLDDCWRVMNVLYQGDCSVCAPGTAPEDALCPEGTVSVMSTVQMKSC